MPVAPTAGHGTTTFELLGCPQRLRPLKRILLRLTLGLAVPSPPARATPLLAMTGTSLVKSAMMFFQIARSMRALRSQ
jgi:hypothetical protein